MDWTDWHNRYETSPTFQARLRMVCEETAAALAQCLPGTIKVLSICAGDGRDVIASVRDHSRRTDVSATLLDNNTISISRGRAAAAEADLGQQLRFVKSDATLAASYVGIGHADIVLLSGFLGHLRHDDALNLISALPMFCNRHASVIWNRHLILHEGTEQVRRIREQFLRSGFEEVSFSTTSNHGFAVGHMRFRGNPIPLEPERKLFEFVGLENFLGAGQAEWSGVENSDNQPATHLGAAAQNNVERTIPGCFEEIAARYSDKIAIGSGTWQPTYKLLNSTADSLARHLADRGLQHGDRAALLMDHDGPLIGAALAILKAGGIVVALNPSEPPARLQQIFDHAGPACILADAANRESANTLAGAKIPLITFEEPHSPADAGLPPALAPSDPAFLIYTSGSTGHPKGVIQTHRNIVHNVMRLSRAMYLQTEDRNVFLASISGGQGLATLWCTLLNGCTLYPFPLVQRGMIGLAPWLQQHRITVWTSSSSVFRSFIKTLGNETFPTMRIVRLGSETATGKELADFKKHFTDHCVLCHTLSSSEAGNITHCRFRRDDIVPPGPLSAGMTSTDIEILLLDEEGIEVPPGTVGEIVIRSAYLSPGYWRDEDLTAGRFTDSPDAPGLRHFRSGDLGQKSPGGQLQVTGRKDAQVKIHGYRVELSEIEQTFDRHPDVEKAIVFPYQTAGKELQLVAYVVPHAGKNCSPDSLRAWILSTLPRYMVPANFIILAAFPLNPHGKIDRSALPSPSSISESVSAPANLSSDTENILAAIWRQVFERSAIDSRSNFFDLGGDSLNAAVIAAQIHSKFNLEMDFKVLAENPTVAQLAAIIDQRRAQDHTAATLPVARVPRDGLLPLSFTEEPMWNQWHRAGGIADRRTVAASYGFYGPLDIGILRDCMSYLVRRHENLRTTYRLHGGKPVRLIHDPEPIQLPELDLTHAAHPHEELEKMLRSEMHIPFDLARLPLVRYRLVKIGLQEHHLVAVCHHIMMDRLSWKNYFREFARLYEAKRHNQPPPLPDSEPFRYADYAAWQRKLCEPSRPEFQATVRWWRDLLASPTHDRPSLWARALRLFTGSQLRSTRVPARRTWRTFGRKATDGALHWGIAPDISERLAHISTQQHTTFFMTRLAVFTALLSHETGKRTMLLGARIANRHRAEFQDTFGFFANVSLLRVDCDLSVSFRKWMDEIRRVTSETFEQAYIPRRILAKELKKHGVRLPKRDIDFAIADDARPLQFGGLEFKRSCRTSEWIASNFTLIIDPHDEQHGCYAGFDANRYSREKVLAFLDRLKTFMDAASRNPDASLKDLLGRIR